jgi:hypothetical protein
MLRAQGLVRWTLNDIPVDAQEGYILCAAALAGPEYGAPTDPSWFTAGLRIVQTAVHVPISGPRSVENY